MSDSNLKKQINNLRSTLFDKNKETEKDSEINKNKEIKENKLVPANINSKPMTKSSGIFHDIKSMDGRLERLEDTFYNYAYDSTKVLTSFHKNTKILEKLINDLAIKNETSDKSIKKIEKDLPHTCPLVPKEGKTIIKRKKYFLKTLAHYIILLLFIFLAVIFSDLFMYDFIYESLIEENPISK